jgi:serine/threonine protein kinase
MPEQPDRETMLRPGQTVAGQYAVERLVAMGGMAAVWAAVNLHTGKSVALKIILRSFASNGHAVELFRREALAASKVNHPNVVNVFDVVDHEDTTCIVMELLAGETLAAYLARTGPLGLDAALDLLLPAMRGIAAANAQGVVHRDLKPANIFLCSGPDGRVLTTKVLDFGISAMLSLAGDMPRAAPLLARFGTPAYMAPEAIELSPSIDGRADVYGFGLLFFEALTGKVPFPGKPGPDLLGRIMTEPAPLVTSYRRDLPLAVARLIARALAKKPSDRFADMSHAIRAAEDLRRARPQGSRLPTRGPGRTAIRPTDPDASAAVPQVQAPFERESSGVPHRSTRDDGRVVHRRSTLTAGLVVLASVTAWAVVRASSSDRRSGPETSSGPVVVARPPRIPLVTELPGFTAPPPSPVPSFEMDGTVTPTVRPSLRTVALRLHKPVLRRASAVRPARAAKVPEAATARRAGNLRLSDF